jgi:hypothetical protein
MLQKWMPYHLLPQKLIMHDSWNLLLVDKSNIGKCDKDIKWTSKKDIIWTHHLQLLSAGKEKAEKELKLPAELDAKCTNINQWEGYLLDPECNRLPAIMVFPPLCLPPPKSILKTDLYLSLSHQVGTGNHSVVHNAVWELPWSLLLNDILYQKCIEEKVVEELAALQTSNEKEWEAKKMSKSVTRTFRRSFLTSAGNILSADYTALTSKNWCGMRKFLPLSNWM